MDFDLAKLEEELDTIDAHIMRNTVQVSKPLPSEQSSFTTNSRPRPCSPALSEIVNRSLNMLKSSLHESKQEITESPSNPPISPKQQQIAIDVAYDYKSSAQSYSEYARDLVDQIKSTTRPQSSATAYNRPLFSSSHPHLPTPQTPDNHRPNSLSSSYTINSTTTSFSHYDAPSTSNARSAGKSAFEAISRVKSALRSHNVNSKFNFSSLQDNTDSINRNSPFRLPFQRKAIPSLSSSSSASTAPPLFPADKKIADSNRDVISGSQPLNLDQLRESLQMTSSRSQHTTNYYSPLLLSQRGEAPSGKISSSSSSWNTRNAVQKAPEPQYNEISASSSSPLLPNRAGQLVSSTDCPDSWLHGHECNEDCYVLYHASGNDKFWHDYKKRCEERHALYFSLPCGFKLDKEDSETMNNSSLDLDKKPSGDTSRNRSSSAGRLVRLTRSSVTTAASSGVSSRCAFTISKCSEKNMSELKGNDYRDKDASDSSVSAEGLGAVSSNVAPVSLVASGSTSVFVRPSVDVDSGGSSLVEQGVRGSRSLVRSSDRFSVLEAREDEGVVY